MPNVMLPDDKIVACPKCKQRFYSHLANTRAHVCVCHFCAESLNESKKYEARCKVCEGFRNPAHTEVVWFCQECASNRQIAAAPRVVDFSQAAVQASLKKPFRDLRRYKTPRQSEILCKLSNPPKDVCCCDGERLIRLLEEFVPAIGDHLKDEEADEKK